MIKLLLDAFSVLRTYPIILVLFVLMEFTRAVGFMPFFPGSLVYAVMIVYAIYNLFHAKQISVVFLFFLLYLIINILVTVPSPIFQSWGRLASFVSLFCCISPLLMSDTLLRHRRIIFKLTLWLCTVLSVGSFFCYFLGINFMYTSSTSFANTAGLFGGLCNHSMMLGPVAALSGVFMAYKFFITRKRMCLFFLLACLGSVLFSASRSALLSVLVGIVAMVYFISESKGMFLKIIVGCTVAAFVTFPLWEGATDLVMQKQNANVESGSTFNSRASKWDNRWEEFESSPLFGVGFAAMDKKYTDDYQAKTGVMEPGSSWLAVLSMLGLVGFGFVLTFIGQAFVACKVVDRQFGALCLGLLFLFFTHLIVEGYIFSSGSFLCFLLWIVVGVSYDNLVYAQRVAATTSSEMDQN